MDRSATLLFSVTIGISALMQAAAGYFPANFFAFPVSLAAAALWLALIVYLYAYRRGSRLVRVMLSPGATILALATTGAGALVTGIFPQLSRQDALAREGIAAALGCYDFTSSWIFVSIIFLMLTVLGFVTVRRVASRGRNRWRFLLNHGGLWIAVFAGFAGCADKQVVRMAVAKDKEDNIAYTQQGQAVFTREQFRLSEFELRLHDNGVPEYYGALVEARMPDGRCIPMKLEVNRPYALSFGRDVYLSGYDTVSAEPGYCVIEIVRQPHKYVILAGIVMMLAGAVMMFAGGPGGRRTAMERGGRS